jgi:DME family drug/metabolite transporter
MHSPAVVRSAERVGIGMVAAAGVLWGTIGVATQAIYLHSSISPVAIGFFRLAIGWPFVTLLCARLVGHPLRGLGRGPVAALVVIGLLLAGYQVCYFAAIARLGVAVATLVTLCTAPVMVAVASAVFLGEPLTRKVALALPLAVAGTSGLVGGAMEARVAGSLGAGLALALGSAAGYAGVAVISRRVAGAAHPLQTVSVGFAAGALVLLPLALQVETRLSYDPTQWALLLYIGLGPTALGYSLFFLGLKRTRATVASIVTLLEPLTATLLAAWMFDEHLGAAGLAGAGLLMGAVGLLYVLKR